MREYSICKNIKILYQQITTIGVANLITNIKLLNFKSIQKGEIEFKPLTIFTGPNSSGKSNIIEAIAIISQIANQAPNYAFTLPQHLEFERAEYYQYPKPSTALIVYKGMLEKKVKIEIHLLSKKSKRSIGYSIIYTSDPLEIEQVAFVNRNPMYHISYTEGSGPTRTVVSRFERPRIWKGRQTKSLANILLGSECFTPLEETTDKKRPELESRLRIIAYRLINELTEELERVYLISAPRGTIPIETQAGPNPTWVGKYGQDFIYILSKIYGQWKYKSIQEKISDWSEKFRIGNIAAGLRKGLLLGADFEDPNLKTIFDMKSASYGSRQLLTIITQIFWCDSDSTLLIEEPEISLHPESQMLIQELFANAVNEGKQIICTTHSPFFILSLSRVIERKILSKNDVAVYHVQKGTEGTETRLLELNDRGFVRGWIPSYMDVENKLFAEWVESLD